MGKPIVYCDACGLSLREEAFTRGKAVTINNRNFCEACKPADEPPSPQRLSSSRIPAIQNTPKRGTPSLPESVQRASSSRVMLPSHLTPKRGTSVAAMSGPPPWLWIVGGAGLLLILGAAALLWGGKEVPPPNIPPTPPAPPSVIKPARKEEPPAIPPSEIDRRGQQARFVADITNVIAETRHILRRREELLGMIASAEKAAGGASPETAQLRRALQRRLDEATLEQGLVGHWKLDEKAGSTAADAGPEGAAGVVHGPAVWIQGRHGNGLAVDGSTYVEIPPKGALSVVQRGSYSLSAWYKPALVPPGKGDQNDAFHGILIRSGLHLGLCYDARGGFSSTDYAEGDQASGTQAPPMPPARYYHVVLTLDRDRREQVLYVDGKRQDQKPVAGSTGRDYAQTPWRIGVAHPAQSTWAWFCRGSIDDVRIYERALAEAEVTMLFQSAP